MRLVHGVCIVVAELLDDGMDFFVVAVEETFAYCLLEADGGVSEHAFPRQGSKLTQVHQACGGRIVCRSDSVEWWDPWVEARTHACVYRDEIQSIRIEKFWSFLFGSEWRR